MRKKTYQKYKQGIFKPVNESKYKGSMPVIYRSSLELKLMCWLDNNDKITSWGSESIVVPYISPKDNRTHRYFVDFNFTIIRNNNEVKKYLVEVKPASQTKPPKQKKNTKTYIYESVQYAVNSAKWEAAQIWCKKHGYEFVIFTEKHIS